MKFLAIPCFISAITFGIMLTLKDYMHPAVANHDNYDLDEVRKLSEDLANIITIKRALDRYRADNHAYPVSKGFDGIKAHWGEARQDWIKGLSPKYIDSLPSDTRNSESDKEQYFYRSNGAKYKIISHLARDCLKVKNTYPERIDPRRVTPQGHCWSYGFWSGVDTEQW
jgi:hypothetical protein